MPVTAGRSEVGRLRETKGARMSVSERIAVRKTFDRNACNGREIGEGCEIECQ